MWKETAMAWEEFCFLGYNAVWSVQNQPTCSSEILAMNTLGDFQQTALHYIPEARTLHSHWRITLDPTYYDLLWGTIVVELRKAVKYLRMAGVGAQIWIWNLQMWSRSDVHLAMTFGHLMIWRRRSLIEILKSACNSDSVKRMDRHFMWWLNKKSFGQSAAAFSREDCNAVVGITCGSRPH
jgi:hypothetical protein